MKKFPLADFGPFETTREDTLATILPVAKHAKEREKKWFLSFFRIQKRQKKKESMLKQNHYNVCENSLLGKIICKCIYLVTNT